MRRRSDMSNFQLRREVEINAAGWMLQVKQNLPLVGRRSSICMLMPVRHAAACLVGRWVSIKCRGSICIHAASKALTADAGEHGRLLLPGWLLDQHHLQHLPPSVLCPMPAQPANAHFEKGPTLSSPPKSIRQTQQQSSVEIIIIPMLKSYWSDDDEGS